MTYNIHPLFVHFPIALLCIYSLIKILPFEKFIPTVSWKHTQRVLLFTGVLGAFIANATGEIAEHLTRPNRQLVEMHSLFASLSTWFYGLLLMGEILYFLTPFIASKISLQPLNVFLSFLQKILQNPILSTVFAFVGLLCISITGLLGGVMVYGISADPIAPLVLDILNIAY